MSYTVLIANDDREISNQISCDLQNLGYRVVEAHDGKSALETFHLHNPDVVILEHYLNDMNGLELCRKMRAADQARIMFFTKMDNEIDQLLAYASGADDYLVRPTSSRILGAHVEALVNRTGSTDIPNRRITVGDLEVDLDSRIARFKETTVNLTRIEFDLLATLMRNPRRVVPRSELIDNVWGDWGVDVHVVESHLSRLRNKIRRAGGPSIGVAVRSVGYKLGIEENSFASTVSA